MAKVLVSESSLQDIADSIRSKNGTSIRYKPYQMSAAIDSLTIGNNALWTADGRMYFENLVIPNGTTSISKYAYVNITGIKSLTIPDSVLTIGTTDGSVTDGAFRGCSNLTSITFGSGLTQIGSSDFWGTGITELDLSNCNNLTLLAHQCFRACYSLTTISLPNSLTTVRYNAFDQCTKIKTVNLEYGFLASITLSSSTKFTADDIIAMFNNLGDVPQGETRTFTLGATNLAKLSDGQKLVATSRGWTLA